ncbi:protein toll [Ixodes scapularis]|nr:protein toll [Ixodes scapularis]
MKISLEGNPIFCDCQILWLLVSTVHTTKSNESVCNGPAWLQGRSLYNLTTDEVTTWYADCDERCTCECHSDDYGREIHVNCSNRRLHDIPQSFPADTTKIYLGGNQLEYLSDTLVKKTPKLRFLDLNTNLFSNIKPSEIPNHVQVLNIKGNKLSSFPLDLVSSFNLSSIQLTDNPWRCDCEDYPFSQWAAAFDGTIEDAEHVVCTQSANALVSGKPFLQLTQKDLCPSALMQVLALGVPFFVLLFMALATSILYLKYKREVKIWLYARGVCGFLQCIKEDDLDEDKLFDVFLSFSSKDAAWAYEHLIPRVEANGFSVCTYDRNFKGGFLIQDIIQEAVSSSRRTLLLLTKNFVDSEWCRWEFRVAHHRALEDRINRLIIVVVDEVTPEALDEELHLYMQATSYLRWGEHKFWDKLIYSLPKKDARQRLILSALDTQQTFVSEEQLEHPLTSQMELSTEV